MSWDTDMLGDFDVLVIMLFNEEKCGKDIEIESEP